MCELKRKRKESERTEKRKWYEKLESRRRRGRKEMNGMATGPEKVCIIVDPILEKVERGRKSQERTTNELPIQYWKCNAM